MYRCQCDKQVQSHCALLTPNENLEAGVGGKLFLIKGGICLGEVFLEAIINRDEVGRKQRSVQKEMRPPTFFTSPAVILGWAWLPPPLQENIIRAKLIPYKLLCWNLDLWRC